MGGAEGEETGLGRHNFTPPHTHSFRARRVYYCAKVNKYMIYSMQVSCKFQRTSTPKNGKVVPPSLSRHNLKNKRNTAKHCCYIFGPVTCRSHHLRPALCQKGAGRGVRCSLGSCRGLCDIRQVRELLSRGTSLPCGLGPCTPRP